MPRAASARIASQPPGSSGASVTSSTSPRHSRTRSTAPGFGRENDFASCAPGFSGESHGPSRCTPATRGSPARSRKARDRSIIAAISGHGALRLVAATVVVPPVAWCRRIAVNASSVASMKSRPIAPCTCRSMNPGASQPPAPSMTCSPSRRATPPPPRSVITPPSARSQPRSMISSGRIRPTFAKSIRRQMIVSVNAAELPLRPPCITRCTTAAISSMRYGLERMSAKPCRE